MHPVCRASQRRQHSQPACLPAEELAQVQGVVRGGELRVDVQVIRMVTVNFASLYSTGQRPQPQSNEPEGATVVVRIATTLSGREIFPSEPAALGSTSPVGALCQEQYGA